MSYMSANICKNHIDVNYRTSITLVPSDGDPPPPSQPLCRHCRPPISSDSIHKDIKTMLHNMMKTGLFLEISLHASCQTSHNLSSSHKLSRLSQAVKTITGCQASHKLSSPSQAVKTLTSCQTPRKLSRPSQAVKPLTGCQASHKLSRLSQAIKPFTKWSSHS